MTQPLPPSEHRVLEILDRIRWTDSDPMGIVHYGAYIRLFQIGEEELLRACGLPYHELRIRRSVWIPRKALHMEFHSPAQIDEEVVIVACFAKIGVSSITYAFEVYRASDRLHRASGSLTVVNVDKETITTRALPEEVKTLLRPYLRAE